MLIWTNIVNPEGSVFICIICMIIGKNKLEFLNFFLYAASVTYITMTLKSIFMDPRPYMVNTDIIPLEKYAEYGNPSGHMMLGFVMVSYYMDAWVYNYKLYTEKPPEIKVNVTRRSLKYLLHFILIAGVYISRIYLGMHSMDQCNFSFISGWFAFFIYNAYIFNLIDNFIHK